MTPEDINTQPDIITANDKGIVSWEQSKAVWEEVWDVVQKVEAIKRLNPLKRIFWLTTIEWWDEVTRLEKVRAAANDNNFPIMTKDIKKEAA